MSTRSVQVGGESLTLCLDCGALVYPSHVSKHTEWHRHVEELNRELKQLRSSAKS